MEYERPNEINEPESLQKIIIKYVRYKTKSMYPEKISYSLLEEHLQKTFPKSRECEYQSDFGSEDKYIPLGLATIFHPLVIKNHTKIEELEKDGYNFHKID